MENGNFVRVAAMVVLYNSKFSVIDNINSYLKQVDYLYVIDNSDQTNVSLVRSIRKLDSTTYISNGGNKGIAYALNLGAKLAIENGFDYLLTMDDDTSIPPGSIKTMLSFSSKFDGKLGLIGGQADYQKVGDTVSFVDYTITSGNLLYLPAYSCCGPFMEELFIDYVDHEYCFRLRLAGYDIAEINSIFLIHKLGEKKALRVFGSKSLIKWTSHNPYRIYYKTRNCIYVLAKYNKLPLRIKVYFVRDLFRDLIKTVFLEDEKLLRIHLYTKAVFDGINKRLGKL